MKKLYGKGIFQYDPKPFYDQLFLKYHLKMMLVQLETLSGKCIACFSLFSREEVSCIAKELANYCYWSRNY